MKTDLSKYDNAWYNPGAGIIKRSLWFATNIIFFKTGWAWPSAVKRGLLRLYGAKIGKQVVIKPSVNIKYAWNLDVGDHAWIGEQTWIDNLGSVSIGAHACISQGALLLCGNHDYTIETFDLIVKDITLEEGVWIGAKAVIVPGTRARSHAVVAAGSVAGGELKAYSIYRGNPAVEVKGRV